MWFRRSAAALGLLGCFASARFAWADYLSEGSVEDVQTALGYVPENIEYWVSLGKLLPNDQVRILRKQLELQPQSASTLVELATIAEFDGDVSEARRLLLQASLHDQTWSTAWALTNFYQRRNEAEPFWYWARESLRLAHGQFQPLLVAASEMAASPRDLAARLGLRTAPELRAYIDFLRNSGFEADAAPVAVELIRAGQARDNLSLINSLIEQFIEGGRGEEASLLWNTLIERGWLSEPRIQPTQAIFRPTPQFPFMTSGFDWRVTETAGIIVEPGSTGAGARISFSGAQANESAPFGVRAAVKPGVYTFRSSVEWKGQAPPDGLVWRISIVRPGSWGEYYDVPVLASESQIRVPQNASVVNISLVYSRPTGASRLQGELEIHRALLEGGQIAQAQAY